MDIPMLNEINENTNAAKKEILEAMPAAGATSAEVEAAKTAIIGAMPSGGDAVPVSITAMFKSGSTSSSGAIMFNVTGKGYIDIVISANATGNQITLVIDGVTLISKKDIGSLPMIDIDNYSVPLKMRFNKSAKLLVYDSSTNVRGIIVFEE